MTKGSQKDYQDFGRAQLDVYNAAAFFGWCYWTVKNDREHWDFEWNIRNNYLQFGMWMQTNTPLLCIHLRHLESRDATIVFLQVIHPENGS